MTTFKSLPDGEHALCRSCQRAGYGPDAWHPVTTEFWQIQQGKLLMSKCKACRSESAAKRFGFVHLGRLAA